MSRFFINLIVRQLMNKRKNTQIGGVTSNNDDTVDVSDNNDVTNNDRAYTTSFWMCISLNILFITILSLLQKKQDSEILEEKKKQIKNIIIILYVIFYVFNLIMTIGSLYTLLRKSSTKFFNIPTLLICVSFMLMIFSLHSAYQSARNNKPDLQVSTYLGFDMGFGKEAGLGMMTNFIFGFIDNLGLFIGMEALDPIFKTFPLAKGNSSLAENVAGGYGNTFSDFIGAFIGTSIGNLVLNKGKVEKTPLWVEPVAIILGCLVGVWVPGIAAKYGKMKLLIVFLILLTIGLCVGLGFIKSKKKKKSDSDLVTDTSSDDQQSDSDLVTEKPTNNKPINTKKKSIFDFIIKYNLIIILLIILLIISLISIYFGLRLIKNKKQLPFISVNNPVNNPVF